jgi:dihydroxyacetone kinase-like predicted kinase
VRDTDSDAGSITAGDWIGIVRGDGIVAIGGTWRAAAVQLLENLITPEREIVTILEGVDATAAMTEELRAWLGENFGNVEVEVHRGGQPLYPYLFGVE